VNFNSVYLCTKDIVRFERAMPETDTEEAHSFFMWIGDRASQQQAAATIRCNGERLTEEDFGCKTRRCLPSSLVDVT